MKKLFKITFLITFIILICFLIIPNISQAEVELESPFGDFPAGEQGVYLIIGRVVKAVLTFTGSLALLMFVYGGFTLITSGGAEEKIQKGKNTLIWATIGLIAIIGSYMLTDFVIKSLAGGP